LFALFVSCAPDLSLKATTSMSQGFLRILPSAHRRPNFTQQQKS
jgi:hypothetical protein